MNFEDVKQDGKTEYYCKNNDKNCTIIASCCYDVASLIAQDLKETDELWFTEACFISRIGNTI